MRSASASPAAQNFTGVEGENITFGPGDLVLTPHDTWHNHGNKGDENAINLSVLDLPLVETLNCAMYFEHDYTEEEEGVQDPPRHAVGTLPLGLFAADLRQPAGC